MRGRLCVVTKRRSTLGRPYTAFSGFPWEQRLTTSRDPYGLLSAKNPVTDAAYRILTDPEERGKHHALRLSGTGDGRDWGKRGRERCSCGRLLEEDEEWLCQDCWGRQEYIVAFDISGGRIVHQDGFPWPSVDSEEKSSDAVTFGPFTIEEAKEFLADVTKKRNRQSI